MRSRRPARAAHGRAWALGLCLLVAPEARAAPPEPPPKPPRPKVVLIADRRSDPIMARVYAELATLGFTVEVVRVRGADAPSHGPIETSAREAGAAVALRVAEVPGGVEVSIDQGATGKSVQRTVMADDPATVAIRAVELLRASLLEVRSPPPSRGEVEADPAAPAVVDAREPPPARPAPVAAPLPRADGASQARPPPPSRPGATASAPATFGVGAAPAVLWSPGGVPATPMLDVSGYAMIRPRLGLSTFAQIPLATASREGKEGTRRVWVALASLGVRVPLGPTDAAWQPSIGAGLAAAWLHVEGEGRSPGYVGRSKDAYAVAPYLRAGLSFAPTPHLRISEHLLAGIAAPRIVIDAAGRATDTWGRPFLGASLGVELVLP
ncbi:hypothetical protein [Sorangium atrum]|uniref:Secreted protein n=1 Tax=Sorangium atrum TaxID=2995308 RepID=A0ABT5C642_9BACT|nr:hypothetical protein [Sorangium aterium]MDC0681898.1 hypothetical protein [Sorangium aterium]